MRQACSWIEHFSLQFQRPPTPCRYGTGIALIRNQQQTVAKRAETNSREEMTMASILRIDDIENKGTSQPASAEDVRGGVKTDSIAMGRRSFTPGTRETGLETLHGQRLRGYRFRADSEKVEAKDSIDRLDLLKIGRTTSWEASRSRTSMASVVRESTMVAGGGDLPGGDGRHMRGREGGPAGRMDPKSLNTEPIPKTEARCEGQETEDLTFSTTNEDNRKEGKDNGESKSQRPGEGTRQ